MMDARIQPNDERFKIEFIGGPHDGLFGGTRFKVNEVETHGDKHPHCYSWVKFIYQRSNPDTDKFFYRETINNLEGCKSCQAIIDREEKYRAERAEREAFREFQLTIEVIDKVADETLSYEWSEAELGKSPDGRLWIRYGSGCSCDGIYEVDWEALTDRAQVLSATRHIGCGPVARANFIAKAQELLGERN